ncbi:MAG: hypothetical protein PHV54_05535 [Tolumonas sp.]|nr:hypothetical protein [Tolumonas sp.]
MEKLSENQFISILDKVVYRHNLVKQELPKINHGSLDPFDWMTQSFCQILWKLTEPQDDKLKEKLKKAVGLIIGNKTYMPIVSSTETLTYDQFSELLSEILKKYESNEFRRYQEADINTILDRCAQFLCEVLLEHLPGENVKSNIKIGFGSD